jgi:hypothetical protein
MNPENPAVAASNAQPAQGEADSTRAKGVSHEDFLESLAATRRRLGRPGPVEIGVLRRRIGDDVPRHVFDEGLLRLESEGGVSLMPHARPEVLDPLELRDCVPSPRGPLYFVVWRG